MCEQLLKRCFYIEYYKDNKKNIITNFDRNRRHVT